MTGEQGKVGFLAAVRGAATAGTWCWENWKIVLLVLGLSSPVVDQFAGPHIMKRVWYNMRHDQARESAAQIGDELKPLLQQIRTDIVQIKEHQILTEEAFKKIPGGARAMSAAVRQRSLDSANAAKWHPPQSGPQSSLGGGVPSSGNLAIIKPGAGYPPE